MDEKIEILSSDLLQYHQETSQKLFKYAKSFPLNMGIGWHYLLDWTWVISQLQSPKGKTILDAGAGLGLLQWFLAEQEAKVISVDRGSRACLPIHLRKRYRVEGLRQQDIIPPAQILNPFDRSASLAEKVKSLSHTISGITKPQSRERVLGQVVIYHQDLRTLSDIPDQSVDYVISVSALEHNTPENLPIVVKELERVLKPGGAIIATLAAAKEKDWFHAPSQGWCYTEPSLRKAFGISEQVSSNYSLYDGLLAQLKNCAELRDNLDPVYFRSGNNGMPWGKWAPQYQPVGVIKVKG